MARLKRKLLQTTLRYYILFAFIILLATSPVYYFTTQWLYLRKTSKTLRLSKKDFLKYSLPNLKKSEIDIWNKTDWSIKIEPYREDIKHDTIFNLSILDPVEKEYDPYRVLLSPIIIENKAYTLMIRLNLIEPDDIIRSTIEVFSVMIVLLITGLFFITRYLSVRLWKSFYVSLNKIEQFEIDKNEIPQWLETDIEEFWRLNQSFNKLINKNIAIYQSQREFIENASHELQTPLAVFQAKLDTLLQTNHITRHQAEIIEYLNQSIARLSRLNKNLLLLSKLDQNRYPEYEKICLNDIIQRQIDFFILQAAGKNVIIDFQNDIAINKEANTILLDVLVSNLLQNAVINTPPNGVITIQLEEDRFLVSNTAQNGPLDNSVIFRRFSKSPISKQGNGLGLAIVKKITEQYGWKISYLWQNNCHVFEVIFNQVKIE